MFNIAGPAANAQKRASNLCIFKLMLSTELNHFTSITLLHNILSCFFNSGDLLEAINQKTNY